VEYSQTYREGSEVFTLWSPKPDLHRWSRLGSRNRELGWVGDESVVSIPSFPSAPMGDGNLIVWMNSAKNQ